MCEFHEHATGQDPGGPPGTVSFNNMVEVEALVGFLKNWMSKCMVTGGLGHTGFFRVFCLDV